MKHNIDIATALGAICGRIIRWWRRTPSEYEAAATALAGVALLAIIWVVHIQNAATVTLTFCGLAAICIDILWRAWDVTKNDDWTL